MPYRRRRRYIKRRPKQSMKRIAKRVVDAAIEDKITSAALTTNFGSIGSSWTHQAFTNLATGTTAGTRVGRRIRVKSVLFYGTITGGALDTTTVEDYMNTIRVVIALWSKQQTFTSSDIGMSSVIQKDSYSNSQLIRKYYDKYIVLQQTQGHTGYIPGFKYFKYYKRFKTPIVITYGIENGTGTFLPDKWLTLSMISDSSVAPNPGFTHGYWKLRYEDA